MYWKMKQKNISDDLEFTAAVVMTTFIIICLVIIYTDKQFFITYKEVFSGLSFMVFIIGLIFTWVQIRAARRRARANTSYQIHKDGRKIFLSITKDVKDYIEGNISKSKDKEVSHEAQKKIHEILMYYVSVYHQWRLDNIDEHFFRGTFLKELYNFLAKKNVNNYWENNIVKSKLWPKEFIELCEKGVPNECVKNS